MYPLFSFDRNIQDLYSLFSPFIKHDNDGLNVVNFKEGYNRFLDNYLPRNPNKIGNSGVWGFVNENDGKLISMLYDRFNERSNLDDFTNLNDLEMPPHHDVDFQKKRLLKAYNTLEIKCEEIAYLFNLVVNYIFFADANRRAGGTSTNAIGCIWSNIRKEWTDQDVCEFLIHEMTHTLIFISEHRNKQFTSLDILADKNNWALTSLFAMKRPLDKGFHAIIITTNILLCREAFLGHPVNKAFHLLSDKLAEQTIESIEDVLSLSNISKLLTEHSINILLKCKELVIPFIDADCTLNPNKV